MLSGTEWPSRYQQVCSIKFEGHGLTPQGLVGLNEAVGTDKIPKEVATAVR